MLKICSISGVIGMICNVLQLSFPEANPYLNIATSVFGGFAVGGLISAAWLMEWK